jgi:hypothetical protein
MISYRLAGGKTGNITDPRILRVFFTRIQNPDWRQICRSTTRKAKKLKT